MSNHILQKTMYVITGPCPYGSPDGGDEDSAFYMSHIVEFRGQNSSSVIMVADIHLD